MDDLTERNRAVVAAFAEQFYGRKEVRGAFERFVSPHYVQHNPGIPDGREAAVERLSAMFADPETRFTVKRILVDGDLACIHLHAQPSPQARGGAVCDLYRLEGGQITEHWDVMQPVPEQTHNANTMF